MSLLLKWRLRWCAASFNILREPLLVQKQVIHQKKSSDIQLFGDGKSKGQEGATPTCRREHILLIFYHCMEDLWLFAFYELSKRLLLSYKFFEDAIWKLNSRAFFWGLVCFSTSFDSFRIWIRLLHPVSILNLFPLTSTKIFLCDMYCQDLWGVFGSDVTLFWVCATHSFTDST